MANPQKQTVVARNTEMDPDTVVTLEIMDRRNAGKTPSSRWGKVKFDDDGVATIKVPLKDIIHVHSFGWLSVEDQEKYLALEEAQPATAAETKANSDLTAVRGANARLAQKNAELEEKLEQMATEFRAQYTAYQDGMAKEAEALRRKCKELEHSLSVVSAERDALKAKKKN